MVNNQLGGPKHSIRAVKGHWERAPYVCVKANTFKKHRMNTERESTMREKKKQRKVLIYFKFSHCGPGAANKGGLRGRL